MPQKTMNRAPCVTASLARRVHLALPSLLLALFASGCAVNEATGKRQLVLVSEAQEIAMGRQNDQQIVQSMGLYPDEDWQSYIQELGADLATRSERPDLPWTFRVIDDPVVNAFALPGGFIYVTRGILSHFNSEAELASVLGHEIGHVTGRHGVERLSKAQLANVGLGVAAVASEDFRPYAGLAQQGLGLLFLKFSRDDERQADDLGLRYLVRGQYDPSEMPKVFQTLDRVSAAQGERIPNWLATHPAPDNRAARIAGKIPQLPPEHQDGQVGRDEYLSRLEGMTFGSNPREGYQVGNAFYHPDLAFALDFPPSWRIVNQRQAVGAVSPNQDAVVVLALASESTSEEAMRAFFNQQGVERGDGWRNSFRYFRTVPGDSGNRLVGLVGFKEHQGRLFRLLSYTADDHWGSHREGFQRSLASFRRLTQRRYLEVEPKRVRLVKLRSAMTLEEFNRRHPSTIELGKLAILNGVSETQRLQAGTLVKRVVGGELPDS